MKTPHEFARLIRRHDRRNVRPSPPWRLKDRGRDVFLVVLFTVNVQRLQALVEHAVNAGYSLSEFEEGGLRLTVRAVTRTQDAVGEPDTTISLDSRRPGPGTIHSSLFGLFHREPGGGFPPFVSVGQTVEAGQKVGLIEAMKVFSPVLSHRAGRIIAVLAEHGDEVECGQPLFQVE